MVMEKTLESPLDCQEIKPVNSKGNQSWTFIGRTDAELPLLWPPDVKIRLTGKDPDAGKGWGQEEKRVTEDEMVGWHHWLNRHETEQTLGDSGRQKSLACCSSLDHKELDLTEWLINNNSLTMKANPLSLGSICSPVWLLILEPHSPLPVSPNFASVCSSGVCQGGWLGAGITGGVTDSWSLLSGPTIGTLRNFRR